MFIAHKADTVVSLISSGKAEFSDFFIHGTNLKINDNFISTV